MKPASMGRGGVGTMEYLWYVLIYSLLGFFLEVAFAWVTGAAKRDRKCHLILPLCPVYGLGAAAILLLPEAVLCRPLLLAPAAMLMATAAEYGMSLFYQYAWGVSFWDYRGLPLNLQGRICLPFSAAWGALALPLVYLIHPVVVQAAALLPGELLVPVGLAAAADAAVTGRLLRRARDTRALMWYRRADRPVRCPAEPLGNSGE